MISKIDQKWDGKWHQCEGCKVVAIDPSFMYVCEEECEGKAIIPYQPTEEEEKELIEQIFG